MKGWYERVLTLNGVPNWTCGHKHRTVKTAYECNRPTPFTDERVLRWAYNEVPPLAPKVVRIEHGMAHPLSFTDEEPISKARYIGRSASLDVHDRQKRDEMIDILVEMLDRAREYSKVHGINNLFLTMNLDVPAKPSMNAAQSDELRRELADASKRLDRKSPARLIEV